MGCCQSRSVDVADEGVKTQTSGEKINAHQEPDVPTGKEDRNDENKNETKPSSDDKTISESKIKLDKDDSTTETTNQNGSLPLESTEKSNEFEEERLSTLYAKPDKTLHPESTEKSNEREEEILSTLYAKPDKTLNSGSTEKSNEPEEEILSTLYAKPDKTLNPSNKEMITTNQPHVNVIDTDTVPMSEKHSKASVPEHLYAKPNKNGDLAIEEYKPSSVADEPEDDYATINETQKANGPKTEMDKSEENETPDYEDVRLGDIAPPAPHDVPPRLPNDTLTRPPRKPMLEEDDMEPPYAESTAFDTRIQTNEISQSHTDKSECLNGDTSPYALSEIVPQSQSFRKRFNSEDHEEAIVELGSPGIKKPSIRMHGSEPTEIDIPDPDYERIEQRIDSNLANELSPELVAYEQTNVVSSNPGNGLVVEEDDYEEIRRSRFAGSDDLNSSQTETQTIDGKEVPVTEL